MREIGEGALNRTAEALLAFQFQEREGGRPSDRARLGALFMAQQYYMQRAFIRAWTQQK